MIMLTIPEVKPFMAKLLMQTTFDSFILRELELSTFTNYTISGFNEAFYRKDEQEEQIEKHNTLWSDVRAIAFTMIKGNKTPLMFKIVLQLPMDRCAALVAQSGGRLQMEELGGLYLNIRFEKNELHIITGTAIKTFTLDKTLEQEWDAEVKRFLREQEIIFEEE
jgi:hypothetical protein